MAKSSLSLGNFVSIVMNKMPVITERPIWFVLVIGILFFTLILGKNIYCGWLCPFGAVQEGIYKALNLTSNRLDKRIISVAGKSRWFFIWLAAMFALFFNNPGIASYEPFSPFFGGKANTAQWILMGLILLLSIMVFRFWCRCFCPVGAILDFLAQVKRKIKKLFGKKPSVELSRVMHNESGCASCSSCQSTCGKHVQKVTALSPFNKFILFLMAIIELLIIAALLQNTGLI
jgi:polyferredoxin